MSAMTGPEAPTLPVTTQVPGDRGSRLEIPVAGPCAPQSGVKPPFPEKLNVLPAAHGREQRGHPGSLFEPHERGFWIPNALERFPSAR